MNDDDLLAVSLTSPQQVGNFPVCGEGYREGCVMDFWHKQGNVTSAHKYSVITYTSA